MSERNTVQKQIIYQMVHALANHPTAEEVYQYTKQNHPNISKATVYRNLTHMARSGDLRYAGSFSGAMRYDHKCHNHYHFICSKCSKIYDVDSYIDDIRLVAHLGPEFEIKTHKLSFEGVCADCKNIN